MIEGGEIRALINPFIGSNPNSSISIEDIKDSTHVFVTHGHGDHLGDTVDIAKRDNANVICNFQIGQFLSDKDLLVHTHIGSRISFDFYAL